MVTRAVGALSSLSSPRRLFPAHRMSPYDRRLYDHVAPLLPLSRSWGGNAGLYFSFFSGAASFGRRGRSDLDIGGLDDMAAFSSNSAFNSANQTTFLAYSGGKEASLLRSSLCAWVPGSFSANSSGREPGSLRFPYDTSSPSLLLGALSTLLPAPVLSYLIPSALFFRSSDS